MSTLYHTDNITDDSCKELYMQCIALQTLNCEISSCLLAAGMQKRVHQACWAQGEGEGSPPAKMHLPLLYL